MSRKDQSPPADQAAENEKSPWAQKHVTRRGVVGGLAVAVQPPLSGLAMAKPNAHGQGFSTRSVLAAAASASSNLDDYYLTEKGFAGQFIFSIADLSAEVSADPERINHIAPDSDPTGASGAAVRADFALDTPVDQGVEYPVPLKAILLDRQVSRMLSGAGDGDTSTSARIAETAKFQAMCDTGRSFEVPEPMEFFSVNTIRMAHGQRIQGPGGFSRPAEKDGAEYYQFVGNGVDPVFALGDGTGAVRQHTLTGVSVLNSGGICVDIQRSPNWLVEHCKLKSQGDTPALRAILGYRAALRDCFISTGGRSAGPNSWAVDLRDNINGLTVENNTITGGRSGKAMRVGQSQAVRVVSNIVEGSRDGFWFASTSDAGDGNCNGLVVQGNYFEQVGSPLVFARHFSIFGLQCTGNFISGPQMKNVQPFRTASIQLGRIRNSLISNNSILPDATEDVYWIWMNRPTGDIDGLDMPGDYIGGESPNALYVLKGKFAENQSVKANIGGKNNFAFMGGGDPQGSQSVQEFMTPMLDTTMDTGFQAWVTGSAKQLGGRLASAELIDYNGGACGTATLRVGRAVNSSENFDVTLSELTFTNGRAPVPLESTAIFDGFDSIYRLVSDPKSSAKFRLRLRYRIN
tara:strand:- start:1970 stop:3865 length:1896 start_codon:yes stop_codon:yes gene_type:complete